MLPDPASSDGAAHRGGSLTGPEKAGQQTSGHHLGHGLSGQWAVAARSEGRRGGNRETEDQGRGQDRPPGRIRHSRAGRRRELPGDGQCEGL